jgi:hypothetical protein
MIDRAIISISCSEHVTGDHVHPQMLNIRPARRDPATAAHYLDHRRRDAELHVGPGASPFRGPKLPLELLVKSDQGDLQPRLNDCGRQAGLRADVTGSTSMR